MSTNKPPAPLGQLISTAAAAASHARQPIFVAHDLELAEWWPLSTLVNADASLDADQLALRVGDAAGVPVDEAQRFVQASIQSGLVAVANGLLAVTEKGHATFASMMTAIREVTAQLTQGVPEADLAATRRTLELYTERARATAAPG